LAASQLRFDSADYFLWGTVKDECYANQSETIQELKHEIKVIDEIHTIEKWVDRMGYCAASRKSFE